MVQANPLFPVTTKFPTLEKDISVDVAIIGAGIAGISSAYHLSQKGYNVAVLEEQEIGSSATGASSGILYYGSGTNFVDAIDLFGKKEATMLWQETKKSIESMQSLAEKNNFECDLRKHGAIMVAKNEVENSSLEKEQKELKSIGIEGTLLSSKELKNYYTGQTFVSGFTQDIVVQIAPALFSAQLAQEFSIPVYTNSPMVSYFEEKDGIVVKTPKATVKAKKILFATNRKPFFGLEKNFFIESSTIFGSQKLSPTKIKELWPEHKFIWSLEDKYDLIYEHAGRAILEVYYFKGAKDKMKYYYPGIDYVADVTWGDAWSKTKDWRPIVGKVQENMYAAIAMGDQGIIMGFTTGMNMPDLLEGKKKPFLEFANPNRFTR